MSRLLAILVSPAAASQRLTVAEQPLVIEGDHGLRGTEYWEDRSEAPAAASYSGDASMR